MKRPVLKLNASYFPIDTCTWQDAILNIASGSAYPINTHLDEDSKVTGFETIKSWEDWIDLDIRGIDDLIHTPLGAIRSPSIIICASYNKILFPRVLFPTKNNIYKRDQYTCQYSGKKLSKDQLSIDHVLPVSRGGEDVWSNMVCCDRNINSVKGNKLPEECGLKLIKKPIRPVNGMSFDILREEWKIFLEH